MSELFQLGVFKTSQDKNDYIVLCKIILNFIRQKPELSVIKSIDYLFRKILKKEVGLIFAYNLDNDRVLMLPDFREII